MTEVDRKTSSLEAEYAVLGAMLLDSDVVTGIDAILRQEHFSNVAFGQAYALMVDLASDGKLDVLTLRKELEQKGVDVGGAVGISQWMDCVTAVSYADYHAKMIVDHWKERQLVGVCNSTLDRIGHEAITDVCVSVCNDIERLSASDVYDVPTAKEIALANRDANAGEPVRLGLEELDNFFGGGVERQSLTVIGAATSVGKSQLALNIVANATYKGRHANSLYIVMEMGPHVVEDRLVAILGEMEIGACKSMRLSTAMPATYKRLEARYTENVKKFAKLPTRIHARGPITTKDFSSMVARYSKGLDLVVLDYLQQISPSSGRQGTRERVEEISRTCKQVAARYNIPVIALAQLSREGARAGHESDGRPKLWHLRESGAIEQDADNVLLLWREKQAGSVREDLEIQIAKNRNGELGMVRYKMDLPTGRIFKEVIPHGAL